MLVRACRPRQWVKNLLVVLAPAAAGALARPGVVAVVIAALVAFCLLSSAAYLVNDVRDREQDRRHPRKSRRPIAAGELPPRRALRVAAILAVVGLAISLAVRPSLAAAAACYLALTTSYSLWWRQIAVLDIVAVTGGFLLRAVAGGAAADVPLSRAFLVVSTACALFVVAGKRYAELVTAERAGTRARPTLRRYSARSLRRLMAAAGALGCIAYAQWSFARPYGWPWLALSLLPFALWLARYSMLVDAGSGEAPEDLILHDRTLLALGAVWLALFAGGIYVAG